MPRPPKSKIAHGLYLRGQTYWLRYTAGGDQIRVTLGTSDLTEAIQRAEKVRGKPRVAKSGRIEGGDSPITIAVGRFVRTKVSQGDFGKHSAASTRQAVRSFESVTGIDDPDTITEATLSQYYHAAKKSGMSEATAQTYTERVAAFARWHGQPVKTPKFDSQKPARTRVIPPDQVRAMLAEARGEMRFILLAGFRAGMRRGEISMARPSWFDLENRLIHIPSRDPETGWRPKSRRARTIPLVSEFVDAIREDFPDWEHRPFCIRPDKEPDRWIYRFDFRKMFAAFARQHCPGLTPHMMRHSYASHLANAGIGVAQLAAWTGDRIATLERHYLHLSADAEKAEAAFCGRLQEVPNLSDILYSVENPVVSDY